MDEPPPPRLLQGFKENHLHESFISTLIGHCDGLKMVSAENKKPTSFFSVFKRRNVRWAAKKIETKEKKRNSIKTRRNQSRCRKLWNLHWALLTARLKKKKQRRREGGKRMKTKGREDGEDESAQEMSVDGQDLTLCGGCQGYMDFFF